MKHRIIPEAFHPGEYIRLALEGKGWTQLDLAAVMDKPANVINDIVVGRRPITPEIAKALGGVFENGAQVWLNLQAAYKLTKSKSTDQLLMRRKELYERAPIREMQKRQWLEESSNIEVLEAQFCQFYKMKDINSEITIAHAARESTGYEKPTNSQLAWVNRAKNLAARIVELPKYRDSKFDELLEQLSILKTEPESVAMIPELLRQFGIRFLVVEHLTKTKIDGACFWLNGHSPVIVVSMRYDRIDYFWHTLIHELMHVKRRDGEDILLVETKLVGDDAQPDETKKRAEKAVDNLARHFLVDQEQLRDFVLRNGPLFSKNKIIAFSRRIGVHPGIIVGQLHHTGEIPYKNFRTMLAKVKEKIISTALTDGWDKIIAA